MMPAAVAQRLNKLDPSIPFVRDLLFASERKARILFDHPASHREWNIIGPVEGAPGFHRLRSDFRLNYGGREIYRQSFELVLHESQFKEVV